MFKKLNIKTLKSVAEHLNINIYNMADVTESGVSGLTVVDVEGASV